MVRELVIGEFTREKWGWLAELISKRTKETRPLDADYFFPAVRHMMAQDVARVWECEGALLGALFARNTFSGHLVGMVLFWWSDGSQGAMKILKHFEAVAKEKKCEAVYCSVFGEVRSRAMERLYRQRGYHPLERIFLKELE